VIGEPTVVSMYDVCMYIYMMFVCICMMWCLYMIDYSLLHCSALFLFHIIFLFFLFSCFILFF